MTAAHWIRQTEVSWPLAAWTTFVVGVAVGIAAFDMRQASVDVVFSDTWGWTERLSPRAPGSEVGGELGVSFRSVGMRLPAGTSIKETTMSPLRARMIEDMTLAGLAVGTQKIYIQAVRRLAAHCRRSPDELGEEEVRRYLLGLRQRGVARGTFKTGQYGLRFLYRHTLGR